MSKIAILFYGIAKENVPQTSQDELEFLLKEQGYDEVILVDWEPWRNKQPVAKAITGISIVLSALSYSFSPLVGTTGNLLSDIPSVRKYIRSAEYARLERRVLELAMNGDEVTILGHSLGCVVATQFAQKFAEIEGYPTNLVLYSPPIGYKGFHYLFQPILNPRIKTRITLGTRDWLSKIIWFLDKRGEHSYNVHFDEVYAGHDLMDHLDGIVKRSLPCGRLLEKIRKAKQWL